MCVKDPSGPNIGEQLRQPLVDDAHAMCLGLDDALSVQGVGWKPNRRSRFSAVKTGFGAVACTGNVPTTYSWPYNPTHNPTIWACAVG